MVRNLDGDFAFVYVNGPDVIAGRDPVGLRPLFYGANCTGRPIAFASEAKALYGAPRIDKVHVFPQDTIWIHNEFINLHTFENEMYANVRDLVSKSVNKRLQHSDRPVGVLCSGGVDSAIITSLAAKFPCIEAFTIEYDNGLSEDSFHAARLCEYHKIKHTIVKFSANQVQNTIDKVIQTCETYDPNTIRAAIPMYLLAQHIAENTDIKVILSGELADEVFAGYLYFKKATEGHALNLESQRLLQNIHMFDLLRADRCFSAFGLEVRTPYADKDLLSYVSHIDGNYKMFVDGAEKQLLRKSFANLTGLVSLRILDRPKEKFSDGCGFSYVPQLLNFVSNNANTLDDKLEAESAYYKEIFVKHYGEENDHWIITRELPDWVATPGQTRNQEISL